MTIGAVGREAPVTIRATRLVLVLLHNLRYQTLYVYLGLRVKKPWQLCFNAPPSPGLLLFKENFQGIGDPGLLQLKQIPQKI